MSFAKNVNVIDVSPSQTVNLEEILKFAAKFKPAYDRILIKRELSALERKTQKSGIILTDQTKDSTQSAEGYLVGFGPTARDEAKKLFGKRILFSKYTGDDITIEGEKFILATDGDIYGELS